MMSLSMKNWSSEGGFSSLVMSVVVMAAGGYRELLGSMKKAERTAKPCALVVGVEVSSSCR